MAGAATITDADGTVVFDSDERLFQVTNKVTGSITLPARTARSGGNPLHQPVDVTANHTIGSINSHADTVLGSFRVTVTGGGGTGVTDLGWFCAGGTYVHFAEGNKSYIEQSGGIRSRFTQLATYTFKASGGSLLIAERTVMYADFSLNSIELSITLKAPTFHYNLNCGSFV